MSTRFWRFVHPDHGAICGPCAWVLGYHGKLAEAVEVTNGAVFLCQRCKWFQPPVASTSHETAPTTL